MEVHKWVDLSLTWPGNGSGGSRHYAMLAQTSTGVRCGSANAIAVQRQQRHPENYGTAQHIHAGAGGVKTESRTDSRKRTEDQDSALRISGITSNSAVMMRRLRRTNITALAA
jgi:hypothetical protein